MKKAELLEISRKKSTKVAKRQSPTALRIGTSGFAKAASKVATAKPGYDLPTETILREFVEDVRAVGAQTVIDTMDWPDLVKTYETAVNALAHPRTQELWVTVYTHEYGTDVAVYPTQAAPCKAKVETARRWWQDRADQDAPDDHSQLTDDQVNDAYWDAHPNESFRIEQATLTLP